MLTGLGAALAEKFPLPVERYDPWRGVELSERARAAGAASAGHQLANLIGLAGPAGAEAGEESGLMPPVIRAARVARRRQTCLLGAAMLLFLALLPPLWHFHRLATSEAERAGELTVQLKSKRANADRNAANLGRIETARDAAAALRAVIEARTNWIRFLSDLQGRLGKIEDVWLDQLSILPPSPSARQGGAVDPGATARAWQLRLSGRLLDVRNPVANVSPDSYARVKQLLAGFTESPFITAVENERFDQAQPGQLRFEVTLAVNPRHSL